MFKNCLAFVLFVGALTACGDSDSDASSLKLCWVAPDGASCACHSNEGYGEDPSGSDNHRFACPLTTSGGACCWQDPDDRIRDRPSCICNTLDSSETCDSYVERGKSQTIGDDATVVDSCDSHSF